jgi:predicted nucleotidyltransferase
MDFEKLLQMLYDGGVKFIVVGGVACALNSFVRSTDDLDILMIDASKIT